MDWCMTSAGYVRYAGTVPLAGEAPFYSMAYDCRLFLVFGEGSIRIREKVYRLGTGDIIYIPPAVPYRFHAGSGMVVRAINFDIGKAPDEETAVLSPVAADNFDPLRVVSMPPPPFDLPFVLAPYGQISRLIEELVREKRFPGEENRAMLSFLLGQCLLLLYRHRLHRVTEKEANLVRRLLRYLEEHLSERIENNCLSEAFSYHPYYLNRVFKKATGETIHACFLRLRVEHAAALLQSTELSIEQIGVSVGFENHAHFSKVFRRYTDMTPGEYRRAHPAI